LDEGRASSPTDLRPSPATPPYHKKATNVAIHDERPGHPEGGPGPVGQPGGASQKACECRLPRAPVDTPGLFTEKGGFAAVAGVWLLVLAGWPTACAFSGAQLSPGTMGSLTASAGELTAPTSSADVASAPTTLFTLLNTPSLGSLSLPGYLRTPGPAWFVLVNLPIVRKVHLVAPAPGLWVNVLGRCYRLSAQRRHGTTSRRSTSSPISSSKTTYVR
jgi:hypothetical protein